VNFRVLRSGFGMFQGCPRDNTAACNMFMHPV